MQLINYFVIVHKSYLHIYQMPQLSELQGRNYFISVTSHNGSVQYIRRRRLFFNSNSLGFLLVKTDKPIYKPEQEGERGHNDL